MNRAGCSPSSPELAGAGILRRFNSPPAPASPHRLSERPCSGTIRKSPWMATVFGSKDGGLATGPTIEPSAAEKGSTGRKTLVDGRRAGWGCSREGAALVRSRAVLCRGSRQRPATCWGARGAYRLDGETPEGIPPYL